MCTLLVYPAVYARYRDLPAVYARYRDLPAVNVLQAGLPAVNVLQVGPCRLGPGLGGGLTVLTMLISSQVLTESAECHQNPR